MRDLVDTTEMYLRTIYELDEEGITPLRARIAERLEQSGPTVSQTVARMERDGLLHVRPDRSLDLTARGRELATKVMRKHRLAELLLTEVLGVDIHDVHEEACRWEHVLSDNVERRVFSILQDCSRSPFGNPVPALEELGVDAPSLPKVARAIDLPEEEEIEGTVARNNAILQVEGDRLRELTDAGIVVGAKVNVINYGHSVILTADNGAKVVLNETLGHAVRIATD